ncbi:MAG: DNA-binding transcriptional ArsR family regulator [Pseudohongiellaceae bacterium]|jgi:DNA-binding transcriptional ArsR family regulator
MTQKQTNSTECVAKLKVLAEATRLAVMEHLMDGPKHVGELNDELCIDQSLLSHHLRVLREAGLVEGVRDGKAVLYRLAPGVQVSGQNQGIDLGCCRLSFE